MLPMFLVGMAMAKQRWFSNPSQQTNIYRHGWSLLRYRSHYETIGSSRRMGSFHWYIRSIRRAIACDWLCFCICPLICTLSTILSVYRIRNYGKIITHQLFDAICHHDIHFLWIWARILPTNQHCRKHFYRYPGLCRPMSMQRTISQICEERSS